MVYLMTEIFETNQNIVIWWVKWLDLRWFESGCIKFDLKILADCDLFFHLKSERQFLPVIHCNNVVSVFALYYCLHWGPNAMTEALVIYILACFATNTFWPMLGEGTRVMREKPWKIINYTEKYCIVTEMRLNYAAIDHCWTRFKTITFLLK